MKIDVAGSIPVSYKRKFISKSKALSGYQAIKRLTLSDFGRTEWVQISQGREPLMEKRIQSLSGDARLARSGVVRTSSSKIVL